MSRVVKKNHYIASPRVDHSRISPHLARNYEFSDGEESQRANTDYASMPYSLQHEMRDELRYEKDSGYNYIPPAHSYTNRESSYDAGSDIYVTSGAYKTASEISSRYHPPSEYSPPSIRAPSGVSYDRRSQRSGGVKLEAYTAPNPLCPNTRGLCCLMLLFNLAIILVTLGFVIVIQFHEPIIVWILGIIFVIFGCLTLIGSLIFCVTIFREAKNPNEVDGIYWTNHWQKKFGTVPP
ncbi:uncharacterized protein LOC123673138 [Harmonia axyridis]|uniref:uncharacterized protein LOC123673138 n=1 Tax=Harmonia axyridis TaxID=115357 RepID=UPI001E2789B0|nr:uncharacterized protein LOC123673138 [Harmonia axyridis]